MTAHGSNKSKQRISQNRGRCGAAAVELAVCLPMLCSLVYGTIEMANAVYLKQSLAVAAYEAANVSAAVGGTSTVALSRANSVLTLLNVNSAIVNISPSVDQNTTPGTLIVVTCSAPLGSNTATGWILGNITITTSCTMVHL
jgi:Flp pilus assembly protein TadG